MTYFELLQDFIEIVTPSIMALSDEEYNKIKSDELMEAQNTCSENVIAFMHAAFDTLDTKREERNR